MKKLLLATTIFVLSVTAAFAQTGILRGTIRDGKTHDVIIGATVQVMGLPTPMGISTDVNGQFELPKVPAGTHTIQVSYVSYKTKQIQSVRIESGNATVLESDLLEDNQQLQEVVVKAGRTTNTEVAVVAEIKQIKAMAVGVSAQQIQKAQDRDAAAAIRRVPGVSIQDNRFVLVRGMGARYNSVLINDVITPSTEVDTRSFSFDLVPSNIIDRMIVYKTGLAELPGDFGGGVIKIFTKRRPDQNFLDVGLTVGYRGNTTGQATQSHQRGGLNWLGLWSADQQLPSSFPENSGTFNNLSSLQRAAYARLLPNNWALQPLTVSPDIRFALNTGRRFDIGDVRISNLTSINYAMTHQVADVELKLYDESPLANATSQQYTDNTYTRGTRLGVMHNWAARISPLFNLEWKTLFNQLSTTETVQRVGQNFANDIDVRSFSQRFENRSILTTQLIGEHTINDLTKINWIGAFGYTGRWEPDWRRARYIRVIGTNNPFAIATPQDPTPNEVGRFFSRLNEFTYSGISNLEHTFGNPTDREPNKIKAGLYYEQKNRDFAARFYGYNSVGENALNARTQELGSVFTAENVNGSSGLTLRDGTRALDSYRGLNAYYAAYVSGDVYLGKNINLTLGFRGEYNDQSLRATIQNVDTRLVSNRIFSPLPSANLTYKLSDRANVRLAYSSTINRPEFREIAPFEYFDFNLLANVRGNTTLTTATMQNLDAKWEFYPTPGELISVTGFYKSFRNPIESLLLLQPNVLSYTFMNAQSAQNYGVEIEVRKGFAQSSSAFLKNLSVVGNLSLIRSRVNVGEVVTAPDLGGEIQQYRGLTDAERPLTGQSPYLINAGVYYAAPKSGWTSNILYNVFGQRVFAVGNVINPTIYEMPRHVVDLNVTKTLNNRFELRLGIQDILNQPVRLAQDFNKDGRIGADVTSQTADADQDTRQFRRGSYYTLSAIYTFGRRIIVP